MKTINRNPSSIDDPGFSAFVEELNGDGLIVESGRSIIAKLHQNDSREFTFPRGSQAMVLLMMQAGHFSISMFFRPRSKIRCIFLYNLTIS